MIGSMRKTYFELIRDTYEDELGKNLLDFIEKNSTEIGVLMNKLRETKINLGKTLIYIEYGDEHAEN